MCQTLRGAPPTEANTWTRMTAQKMPQRARCQVHARRGALTDTAGVPRLRADDLPLYLFKLSCSG